MFTFYFKFYVHIYFYLQNLCIPQKIPTAHLPHVHRTYNLPYNRTCREWVTQWGTRQVYHRDSWTCSSRIVSKVEVDFPKNAIFECNEKHPSCASGQTVNIYELWKLHGWVFYAPQVSVQSQTKNNRRTPTKFLQKIIVVHPQSFFCKKGFETRKTNVRLYHVQLCVFLWCVCETFIRINVRKKPLKNGIWSDPNLTMYVCKILDSNDIQIGVLDVCVL